MTNGDGAPSPSVVAAARRARQLDARLNHRMVSAHEAQVSAAISFLDARGYWGSGGFEAAGYGDKSLQEDHPWVDSAKSAVVPQLWNLRARCRNIVRNSPFASGCIRRIKNAVTGVQGLKPKAAADPERLGVAPAVAEMFARDVSDAWRSWSSATGGCDDREERSFGALQRVAMDEVLNGGDVLVVHKDRPGRAGIPFRLAVQFIEAERVSNPNSQPATTQFAAGVELDGRGRVTNYHVSRNHPGDSGMMKGWDMIPARTSMGERMARLLYPPGREGEIRGIPALGPSYITIRKMADYLDAEGYRALTQGLFTAFVKTTNPQTPLAGLGVAKDLDADWESNVLGESQDYRLGHGSVERLLPNEEIQFPRATAPNGDVGPWIEVIERHVGMSLGVPYEVLVMRFDSSYSASRGAVEEAWQTFRMRRHWLVEHFCQPLYDAFVAEMVATGEVYAPGFFTDPRMRRLWTRADWVGSAPPVLDPVKAVAAVKEQLGLRLTTYGRAAQELTGTDIMSNIRKQAEELRLMAEAGLTQTENEPGQGDGGNMDGGE